MREELKQGTDRSVVPWTGYRRALHFVVPYWPRLILVLFAGIAATGSGLAQPYLSKLLIDDALLKRNFRMLLIVSAATVAITIVGFALNIFSSFQYVRVSAGVLFDMRLALYRHLQSLSPRFWAQRQLGDVVSRINNDIAEVQRVSADSLMSVLSNLVFLVGSAIIMAKMSGRLFLLSAGGDPREHLGAQTLSGAPGGAGAHGAGAQRRYRKFPA